MSFLATIPTAAKNNSDGQTDEEWDDDSHDRLGWGFDLFEVEEVESAHA